MYPPVCKLAEVAVAGETFSVVEAFPLILALFAVRSQIFAAVALLLEPIAGIVVQTPTRVTSSVPWLLSRFKVRLPDALKTLTFLPSGIVNSMYMKPITPG
jgi:hypothetical protein